MGHEVLWKPAREGVCVERMPRVVGVGGGKTCSGS